MVLSRREFLTAASGLTALLASRKAMAASRTTGPYAVAGTIITGGGSALTDHAVLIRNGRIEAIVPRKTVADRKIIALPNATILPGIINCHVHRIHSHNERRERYLEHGVTSIGDAASPLSALPALTNSPSGTTASAACAGPMLCPPGGYPLPVHSADHGLVVNSPKHGRERVRQLANSGATMVKLAFEPGPYTTPWPLFDLPTAAAICDEARRRGMTIRCHVEDLGGLESALDAGVHTIEHVPHRWIHNGTMRPVLRKEDGGQIPIPAYQSLLERMARDKVILTPTLDVLSRSVWNGPELYEPVRFFANLGGRIAVGNDHPYRRTDAGMPLKEMQLLQRAGLDNSAIVTSATQTSATACGYTNRGVLAPGMTADLLVVTGDPLADMSALAAPTHIIKDGEFVR